MEIKEEEEEDQEEKDNSKLFLTLMEGYSDSTIPLLSDLKTETTTAIKAASTSRKRRPNSKPSSSKASMEEFNRGTQRRRKQELFQMEACASRKRPPNPEPPPSSSKSLMEFHKEKQRRDKISIAYSILKSMVPNIPFKATRTKMVEETINHIKELEEELKGLEAQKKASMAAILKPPTFASYNDFITLKKSIINVVVSGKIAFLGINSEIKNQRFLFNKVVAVFEKHSTEILTATISVDEEKKMSLTVTALVNGNGGGGERGKEIEGIKEDLIRLLCSS